MVSSIFNSFSAFLNIRGDINSMEKAGTYIENLKSNDYTPDELLKILSFVKGSNLHNIDMKMYNQLKISADAAYKKHLSERTTQHISIIKKNTFQEINFLEVMAFVCQSKHFDNKFLNDYIDGDLFNKIFMQIKIKALEIVETGLNKIDENNKSLTNTTSEILKYITGNIDRLFFHIGNEGIKEGLLLSSIADKVNNLPPDKKNFFNRCLVKSQPLLRQSYAKLILSMQKKNITPEETIKNLNECIPSTKPNFHLTENILQRLENDITDFKIIVGKMLLPECLSANDLQNHPLVLSETFKKTINSLILELKKEKDGDDVEMRLIPENAMQV